MSNILIKYIIQNFSVNQTRHSLRGICRKKAKNKNFVSLKNTNAQISHWKELFEIGLKKAF